MRAAAALESALMVMNADKDGPAAAAGIAMGDVLLQVDGVPLDGMHALSDRLGPDSVGKRVDVKLIRAGAILSMTATIAARPAASEESAHARRHHHRHHHRGGYRHGR
jgi:S1-C subfamily serine protease